MERETVAQQLERRKITLAEGETALRYRELSALSSSLVALANKVLPTKEARIHVAACARAIKPLMEDYSAERQYIALEHAPPAGTVGGHDNEKRVFVDVTRMEGKLFDLDEMVVVVRLPIPITDTMLPVNSKEHPKNEDALTAILADLGPLYPIEARFAEPPK